MLSWHLCSHPWSPDLIPTSGILFLYRVCSRALCLSMQTSCHVLSDLLLIRIDHCSAQRNKLTSSPEPYSLYGHIPFHSLKLSKPILLIPCLGLGSYCFSFSSEYSELYHLVFAAAKTLIIVTRSLESEIY